MRPSFTHLAVAAAMLAVVACGDSSTSPQPTAQRALSAPNRPAFDYHGGHDDDDESSRFTVTPDGGTFSINGLFSVNFPANSICDPEQSNYADWGTDCVTLTEKVRVHARIHLASDGISVDFSPRLRFRPMAGPVTLSTDIFAPVLLSNREYFLNNPSELRFLAMSYVQSPGADPIADYKADPSLITHVNLSTGKVWRVIWHFSGYLVAVGVDCTVTPTDPSCIHIDVTP